MQWFSALLLAISSNLDNMAVGLSYGARNVRIFWPSNLLIALLTSMGTGVSMSFGAWLSQSFCPQTAGIVGSLLIMAAGVWVIWLDRRQQKGEHRQAAGSLQRLTAWQRLLLFLKEPYRADVDGSKTLGLSEAALLGAALTLNNISSGIGAGLAGVNITVATAGVFIFSILTLTCGIFLGRRFISTRFRDQAGVIGGMLLIVLGCFELFT